MTPAVGGKNSWLGPEKMEADTGSFDSENGLARESVLSAQDDNVGEIEMKTDAGTRADENVPHLL